MYVIHYNMLNVHLHNTSHYKDMILKKLEIHKLPQKVFDHDIFKLANYKIGQHFKQLAKHLMVLTNFLYQFIMPQFHENLAWALSTCPHIFSFLTWNDGNRKSSAYGQFLLVIYYIYTIPNG